METTQRTVSFSAQGHEPSSSENGSETSHSYNPRVEPESISLPEKQKLRQRRNKLLGKLLAGYIIAKQ